KVLNYVKVGLDGQTFQIDGKKLEIQSDGTNSFKYIEIFLSLLISLTRRDYITPIVFIDEPEIGLHPKKSEQLI
ncbi:ATP-binding protein, partial [Salmonella enterica subsp. enterica serovar Kintambo]|nr:ATP-binding protein [Salmonella enterica subsp. enterica serovar Kintambo]